MKNIAILLFFVFLISCNNNKKQETIEDKQKPLMSINNNNLQAISVKPSFFKDVAGWKHLKLVDSFLVRYKTISPNEALNNALELKDLVKNLKDSIKPKMFNTPSFETRVNILYNETLRLVDLIDIKAITAKEVNKQVEKTINAFSSVNLKINTMLLKNRLEDEMDIDLTYIGLDSTRIDSVSKKSIDLRKQTSRNK